MSAKLDDEVTRLARLSTDVIALGHIRSAEGQRSSEVWQTLQEVLALYRETCEQASIHLVIKVAQDGARVPFAAEELHQIFQNLLVNAIDATPPEQKHRDRGTAARAQLWLSSLETQDICPTTSSPMRSTCSSPPKRNGSRPRVCRSSNASSTECLAMSLRPTTSNT